MATDYEENMEESEESGTEEIVPEEDLVENALPKLKKLRSELKACQTDKQEYLTLAQRARADYMNLQQSMEKGREDMLKFAQQDLLEELISLAESFEAAIGSAEWQSAPEAWRKGVESIYAKLKVIFEQSGIVEISPITGAVFNPNEHEAMMIMTTVNEVEDDTVATVVQKGYRLHERVLRPAKVQVANFNK